MSVRRWCWLLVALVATDCNASPAGTGEATSGAVPTATASASGGAKSDGDAAGADPSDRTPKKLAPIAPEGEHPFSAKDLLAFQRVSSATVSPDGTKVAYVLRSTDLEDNRGRSDVWVVDIAGGSAPRQLTTHRENDGSPAFSPDGKTLFFCSSRGGSPQIWKMPVGGGEPSQVTDLPRPIGGFKLSPDGKTIAFVTDVFLDCDNLQCTADRLEKKKDEPRTGAVYDRLFVRHWDSWKDGRRSHLFVVPVEGGEPKDLTSGLDADVPSKPFGGMEEVTFSPDSKTLVYTARVAGPKEPWSTNFDLFAVPVAGGDAQNLTDANEAWDTHPVFSPDGKTLAYVAMERAGFEADRFRLMLKPYPEGEAKALAGDFDRSIADFFFDGSRILALAQDTGQKPVFAIPLKGGEAPKVLVTRGTVSAPAMAGDKLIFTRNDLSGPNEIWVADADGRNERALTSHNAGLLAKAKRGDFEPFSFAGAGGDTVYGWMVKPVNFDPNKKYPLAFLIHGGPQWTFANRFHYRWNAQTYAGQGYAVVMIDFHGSTGYGQAFTDSITGDWGGKPLEDLQRGLAFALSKYPFIDGDKACALGASYGGYMVNWIAGNWPDGFDCLVNHDGIFDQRSMYYATEELWFPEWEHGGPYYGNPGGHEKHNPSAHVTKWKTPMLVIHGSLDYRVPLEQGLATFNALQRRGIESRFLHFPDENHWVLKPHNVLQWHEEVERWLAHYLK